MFQEDKSGYLTLSICDPHVDIELNKKSANYERSRSREIKILFDPKLKAKLISSTSGLPQTNPPLGAKIENHVLTYTTRNAVSDNFKVEITQP